MTRRLRLLVLTALLGLFGSLLAVNAASAAPTATVAAAASSDAKHITVPGNYVYNPNAKKNKTLHDYCTKSPDEFRAPGKNANFRGSCARHDMCIEFKQAKRSTCDARLLSNMKSECRYTYGRFDPRRGPCLSTAYTYYLVVRAKTAIS